MLAGAPAGTDVELLRRSTAETDDARTICGRRPPLGTCEGTASSCAEPKLLVWGRWDPVLDRPESTADTELARC